MTSKEKALNEFVRKNYKLLSSKNSFDKFQYKNVKRAFFDKFLRLKFGMPPDKIICRTLVSLIIKERKIQDVEQLNKIIEEIPFLKSNNILSEDFTGEVAIISEKYALIEKNHDLEEFEKQERTIEWIKKEQSREIDELIKSKVEEYKKLPSILDDQDFEEPNELPKIDLVKEWWEELNLRENPFQGPLDGFSLIDQKLYNEIIVETEPIKWALKEINKSNIDIFHRGYLLAGEYGTGKTTFFDFIEPNMILKNIEPIRIALSENISEAHYVQKFEKELCMEVAKISRKRRLGLSTRIMDFEEVRLVMMQLQEEGIKGFFIFIDDLHKHSDKQRVFNFLSNLQITKNIFSRDGINVAFMVSGFPSWRIKIKQDSALTGFFDAADELTLPEVTPELAASAIKKRLQAFSINSEKILEIKEQFLVTIFKKASSQVGGANIGFRPYIQEALNKFKEKKFDILSIDFTRPDEFLISQIKNQLEDDSEFKKSIDKLIYGNKIQKKEVRELTLKILCEVYLRHGIVEDDKIFKNNLFSFKQLSDCKFIQKFDRNGELVWKVSPFLSELNKRIVKQYNLSLEDYIVPIYSVPLIKAKKEVKAELTKIELYRKDITGWKGKLESSILIGLENAAKLYSEYIDNYQYGTSKVHDLDREDISKVEECIWTLMKCIMRFESPAIIDICGESNINGWNLRHRSLECSQHFISFIHTVKNDSIDIADIARIISFANESFDELWNEFKESIFIYNNSKVKCCGLPKKMLKIIYPEYNKMFSVTLPEEEYFDAIKNFTCKVESVIREYLLISTMLIFGPYHTRIKYYPEDIKKYITKESQLSSVSYESYNEFENLNRGQYRLLFTQISKSCEFYRYIIQPIISKWDSRDIQIFFNIFGDINISVSHLKTAELGQYKNNIPTFFRLSCRLIEGISLRLVNLIRNENTIIKTKDEVKVCYGYKYIKNQEYVRIVELDERESFPKYLFSYDISNAIKNNVLLESSDNIFGGIEFEVLNIEEIRIKFNLNYCEAVSLITYYLAINKIHAITMYGTNLMLLRN